jgi:hypothetical protein
VQGSITQGEDKRAQTFLGQRREHDTRIKDLEDPNLAISKHTTLTHESVCQGGLLPVSFVAKALRGSPLPLSCAVQAAQQTGVGREEGTCALEQVTESRGLRCGIDELLRDQPTQVSIYHLAIILNPLGSVSLLPETVEICGAWLTHPVPPPSPVCSFR